MKEKYRRILVAVDGTSESKKVLEEALTISEAMNAKLIVLYVMDTQGVVEDSDVSNHLTTVFESNIKKIEEWVQELNTDEVMVEIIVERGITNFLIVIIAKNNNIDLILLGTSSKGILERTKVGSTATYVINNAHCNVMVVR